jgi:DNA-binding CsgD family transcriptional regulator
MKAKREHLLPEVKRLYEAGYPVLRIAREIGKSRGTVNNCLADLGIEKPTVSEGNILSAALTTPEQRKSRVSEAHKAIRMAGESPVTRQDHSLREQSSLRYIGEGEKALQSFLEQHGFECIPQAARHGYNIDILVGNVAVEVHNYTNRPHSTTRNLCRIVKLLSSGLHCLYIKTGPDTPMSEAAMEQTIAFLYFARSYPTTERQYRVIRGDGEIDHTASRQFDEVTSVIVAHCGKQA